MTSCWFPRTTKHFQMEMCLSSWPVLDKGQYWGIIFLLIIVRQGPTELAIGSGDRKPHID